MELSWEKKYLDLLKKSPKTKEEVEEMVRTGNEFSKELQRETKYLLHDIEANGLIVDSVWDLVNTRQIYPEAIEPLRNHLTSNYHIRNKEAIIRALGVKEAGIKEVKALINEYEKLNDKNLKSCIILSIYNILRPQKIKFLKDQLSDGEDIIDGLIKNKKLPLEKFASFFRQTIK